ncbi:MAG TPA: LacI family DNA-binding transcriptional regulator, partial [Dongiaceae bacterium]|nr:LacI family DNA-binding transcriptional regulator [Dongiaceae bacterium]
MAKSRKHGAATVKDVARLARVSAITVSRALNSPESLSAETMKRVRRAIERTGYVPNLLAGGLRSARSKLVAAVVPTVAGPVFLDTIQALTDALDEHGYQLLLGQSGYRTSREDALLDAVIGRRPVGMVLTGMAHSAQGRRRLLAAGIPIVETWDLAPEPIDMAVGFDHERIGEAVCRHFHERGRRHVALVSGDDERAHRRAAGFMRAAKKLGLGAQVPVHWIPAPTTLAAGREGLAQLLARAPRIDGIWGSSDLVALGVLTEAHQRGIAVPRDLAVVGFGDLQFAAGVVPSLTSVRVDGARIGRTAARMIIDRAEGRHVAEPVVD